VVLAERWRGKGGEIDLIARDQDCVIFIEVKQSATHDSAAIQLSPRQMGRIAQAAAEFLAEQPAGQSTPSRFDVALVDRSGAVLIHENAFFA
jgi:putative endonuclease